MSAAPPRRVIIDPDRSKSWLRRVAPVLRTYRVMFVSSLVLSFVGLILQVEIPALVGRTIDDVGRHHDIVGLVEWIAAIGIARCLIGYLSRLFLFQTAFGIEFDLRTAIYEHLTRLSFGFFDRVQSGQLISRANSDIRSVQMYLAFAPSIVVQCLVGVVAFAKMLQLDPLLAVVAMSAMPFIYLVGMRMRQIMFPVSWLIQARLAEVATIVDENVNGVRVVRSFAAEDRQLRSLAKASQRVQWSTIVDADLRARWGPLMENLPRVGLALVLLFGGWQATRGQTSIGTIVAFNSYLFLLSAPFRMLGMIIMMGQRAAASAQRIYEIMDEQPEVKEDPAARDLTDCRGDVELDNVYFGYGDTPVLSGLSMHLRAGETVALVGPTGCGKSTVARLVDRFYDVQAGAVRIDSTDVRDLTLTSLRANVGLVLDEPFLFSASIHDNIAYGDPDASREAVVAAARAAAAEEFILDLPEGYDTVVGERGYTLSGGQRQRLAIARALLLNPPVLILDDATSAIDVRIEEFIHNELRALLGTRTTLIVAHRLSTISLADRVVLLDEGRAVATGTHRELLETVPRYAEVLAQVTEPEEVVVR